MSHTIATALKERKEWTGVRWLKQDEIGGREVKLLDYACGTGSITRAVGPWVTNIKGLDISENMVKKFNEDAAAAGLKPEQVSAEVGDLLGDEVPDSLKRPELSNFDVAIVGLGFHHFENPVRAIERLSERLKPEGTILIIDFLPFDDDQGQMQSTIKHSGFAKANIEKLFSAAKLEKFSFSVVDEPVVMELESGTRTRKLFIARGKKQPTTWAKVANWVYNAQVASADQWSNKPRSAVPDSLGIFGEASAGKEQKVERRFI